MIKKRAAESINSQWNGQWVIVGLKDGSYYVGKVTSIQHGKLILNGEKGDHNYSNSPEQNRAHISGFLESLLGGIGGGAVNPQPIGANNEGLQSEGGTWSKAWPVIQIGFGMMKFIMPLLGKFFI